MSVFVIECFTYLAVGVMAMFSKWQTLTMTAFVGLILGILTVRENVYYRFFPILGIILNVLCLVCISMILYLGNIL